MAQDDVFQGEMDPEIAALLGKLGGSGTDEAPEYTDAFADESQDGEVDSREPLEAAHFPEITKRFEDVPHKAFEDPAYYKNTLAGEGEKAKRIHGIFQKLLAAKDPKDRGVFRQQFVPAFWDFLGGVARKATSNISDAQKYLLRFGILHPIMLNADNRNLFAKIIVKNDMDQPIYYADEWYKAIGNGTVRASSTDEVKTTKGNVNTKLKALHDKAKGKLDGAKTLIRGKADEIRNLERQLQDKVKTICEHVPSAALPEISECYSESQKRIFNEMQENIKLLVKSDHDLEVNFREYHQADEDVKTLRDKIEAEGDNAEADVGAIDTEYGTVRQMVKMTIGRQGNHFPLLTNEYFHCVPNDIGTRENVISVLSWIETIDPEAMCRMYKNKMNRIVPYVVLLPTYGDYGMCWEPYDRYNRATSRGRIAVPMYPKNLKYAVLYAIGDLRWQVAKEKASFYWMEEGITGNYYQWFQKMKLKGDLKETFIEDYITWMTKESEGTMKLDKELRGVFWRYLPFSQPVKEKLKTRSFAYQELYQRDVNRSMSDGY